MANSPQDSTNEDLDAVSLHTIAEQADAYATQEQEDADFAFALALEDEETRRLMPRGQQSQNQGGNQNTEGSEVHIPYRDDPDHTESVDEEVDVLTRYRDDPDAEPTEIDETTDGVIAARPTLLWRKFSKILKIVRRAWCIALVVFAVIIVSAIGIVLIMVPTSKGPSPKDRAWSASHSTDGDLRLPQLYPSLEDGADTDCKRVWEKYARTLRCHRMILSAAWDDGDAEKVKAEGADPFALSEEICTEQCRASIGHIRNPMHNGCFRRTDRFDILNYGKDGVAFFDKREIEEGPIHVWRSLERRYTRLCAKAPKDTFLDKSEWGTCSADLWMRWGIVDNTNEANMNGLDTFFEATDEKKTIKGGKRTGTIDIGGGKTKNYDVDVPTRKVGPGINETECGYCTLDWLERKMASFEYSQMLDPNSGEVLGLSEFSDLMYHAIRRCEGPYHAGQALIRVHRKWTKYGWWCDRKPCGQDLPISSEVRSLLHGVREDDHPLDKIQVLMEGPNAPKEALQALYDGTKSLPCSIWFNEDISLHNIVPHQYRVQRLCSDACRNAVDRLQQQHGQDFSAAASNSDPLYQDFFSVWFTAMRVVNQTCLNPSPRAIVREGTSFCAPGYAALGHPEWIFSNAPPSKSDILSSFATGVDKLAASLPRYVQPIGKDEESQRTVARLWAESVCNTCAGELLVGRNPDLKGRVDEFYDDEEVDWNEYKDTAKKYFRTCLKMVGHELNRREEQKFWNEIGLDRQK